MKRAFLALTLALLAGSHAVAQDAKSFALAGCGTATSIDAFSVYWNPAALAIREDSQMTAAASAGFSAWDSSNLELPALDYTGKKASETSTDPVLRSYRYQGLFAVQHRNYGGGVLYEKDYDQWANQSSLDFIEARRTSSFAPGATYTPEWFEHRARAQHILVGTGKSIPVGGAIPFLAAGASLKYTLGSLYEDSSMAGYFVHGASDGLVANRFRSDSGKGISYDVGTLAKLASGFQAGCVWENLKSSLTWDGVEETLRHNVSTGVEEVVATREVERKMALPRAIRIGMVLMPEGKDIQLIAESRHQDRKTRWRFGMERFYPAQKVTMRIGLLKDPVSDKSAFTVGGGWFTKGFDVNAGFLLRKFPAVLDSQAIGGAISASYMF